MKKVFQKKLEALDKKKLNNIAKQIDQSIKTNTTRYDIIESINKTKKNKELRQLLGISRWGVYKREVYGISSILSLLIGIYLLFPQNVEHIEKKIIIGFTNHKISNNHNSKIEEEYNMCIINPANEYLRTNHPNLSMEFSLAGGNYTDLYDGLKGSHAFHIAFSPPFTFLHKFHEDPALFNENFIVLGKKVKPERQFYKCRIISCNPIITSLDSINVNNYHEKKFQIYLGSETNSTSTYVIPSIFLKENGIYNYKSEKVDRIKICNNIRMNKKFIGFLSDEDWDRKDVSNENDLNVLELDVTIPYDAIVANKQWWEKGLTSEERNQIIQALFYNSKYTEETEEWSFIKFELYISSGIIVDTLLNSFIVSLPDKGHSDFYDLEKASRNKEELIIVDFKFKSYDSGQFEIDVDSIGTGIIKKINDKYILSGVSSREIAIGNHLLSHEQFDRIKKMNSPPI